MINYSYVLSFNNVNDYSFGDIYDYDTFIFNPLNTKPTESELNQFIRNYKLYECKQEAKRRIQATDWSVLPDVALQNKSEFESYRAQLRELILNPVETPEWPTEPQSVWR